MSESEQQHVQLLALFNVVPHWVWRVSGEEPSESEPKSGSSLADDDQLTGKYPVSGGAWHHITVAVDHFNTLRAATVGRGDHENLTLLPFLSGQYTLLRAVIENACTALWLLESPSQSDRVLRRLELAANDIRNDELYRALINRPGRKTKEQLLAEVRTIANAAVPAHRSKFEKLGYKEIVSVGGAASTIGGDRAVFLWRSCSGLAHGDGGALLHASDHEFGMGDDGTPTLSAC
ncbi:hypothetical protein AB0B66_10220 [Catellatospora sp. NPDC049111]|uniref:hypothetical protein n=1 Tax=Catellatospora sp. NPDC049111 TaxID=3155271 RepID=UPI0033FD0BBA